MKIVKWTIGNASDSGFSTLKYSIKKIKQLIPDAYLVVCHNGKIDPIGWEVDQIIDQRQVANSLPYEPKGNAWKLYPPRIDINAWELWLDNDVILHDLPPAIYQFFKGDSLLISEAAKRSYSDFFDPHIPKEINYNSGILGLPPNFDFKKHILSTMLLYEKSSWDEFFDEQSVVSQIFYPFKPLFVSLKEVSILENEYIKGTHGVHFIGINHFESMHMCWSNYKNELIKI